MKKGDLDRKVNYIKEKINLKTYNTVEIIKEVNSGLNDKRNELIKLLELAEKHKVTDIVWLTRFGFHYLEL